MLALAAVFGIIAILLGAFGLRTRSSAVSGIAWLFAAVFLLGFVISIAAQIA
jgi:hypothetical protein